MAATATGKVIIKGENNISSAVKSASKDLSTLTQAAEKVGSTLKKAFTVTAIVAAVAKLGQALKGCFNDFNEAERKYKQLSLALGDTKAFDKISKKIKELSKITLSSKDDIESMVSELAGLGYSSDQIEKISEAAVHLSNITGKDLNSSMTTLMNTYNGNTKALQKLGIDTSKLSKYQLEHGAAVDLVIGKYADLSKSMAEADSSQRIQNIKNNLGDIKQSVGDIVNFSITPLLGELDAFTEKAARSINEFAQRVKVVFENLPEVLKRLGSVLGNAFANLFKLDTVVSFFKLIISRLQLIGTAISDIGVLIYNVIANALAALKNYIKGWIVQIADEIGINIADVINSIGEWLLSSPVGKVVDSIVSTAVNGIKYVLALIGNIPGMLRIVFSHLGDLTKEFLSALPKSIVNLFNALKERAKYVILHIKNSFLQAIEDAITALGNTIQNTWVGKALAWMGLDVGGKLASVDFGINRDSEREAYSNSQNYMTKVGESFSGVNAVVKDMGKEISDLMHPVFDKFIAQSTTFGQKMATWTAKSSEDYYKAAKENFNNIGDFLQDWSKTFLGDLGDNWKDLKDQFSDLFTNVFEGNWDEFTKYLKKLTDEGIAVKQEGTTTVTPTSGGNGEGAGLAAIGGKILSTLESKLGEAGELIGNLANNMSQYGPMVGAILTAVEYVIEGFAEVISGPLNDLVKFIIEPLREFGKILGELLIPLLDMLMPLLEKVADFSMKLFHALGVILEPIIQVLNSALAPVLDIIINILEALMPVLKVFAKVVVTITGTIQYVIQVLQHWVASIMNWLAGLNIFGWRPFAGLAMTDPGSPGSYGDFIKSKWAAVDAAFERQYSSRDESASTSTAVQNASYSGATTVYLNVYQNGVVVGDGGINEFAMIIRDKIEDLNYLGR